MSSFEGDGCASSDLTDIDHRGPNPKEAVQKETMEMKTMEMKTARARRSLTPEFKAEIVERCQRRDGNIGQVTTDLDLSETNGGTAKTSRDRPR